MVARGRYASLYLLDYTELTSVPSRRHKAAALLCTTGASTACFVSFTNQQDRALLIHLQTHRPRPALHCPAHPGKKVAKLGCYVCPTPDYPAQLSKVEACSDQKTTLTYAQSPGLVITITFPYPLPCSGQVFTSIPPTLVQAYQLPS